MTYNKSITATVYIVNNNRVLLHMHKKYKTWFPVGGHLEPDEFPHEAAIREAKEESGLDIELIGTENYGDIDLGSVERLPLPFVTCRCGDSEEFLDFIYIGRIISGKICPGSGESTDFKWFDIDELKTVEKTHIRNMATSILRYVNNNINSEKRRLL